MTTGARRGGDSAWMGTKVEAQSGEGVAKTGIKPQCVEYGTRTRMEAQGGGEEHED